MAKNNINIDIADWSSKKHSLMFIRRNVFIEEQKVPEDMEWDEFDHSSTHFLATCKNKAIACGRLKTDGQIGRMAVLAEYRNQGIGSKLLAFIIKHASQQQLKQVTLHAQTSAVLFYKKQGFTIYSEIFFEANIPHCGMLLKIC